MATVTDLQELGGAATGVGSVGEEHLMAKALVLVEQGQLGSGVRAFAAHEDAGASRIAGQPGHQDGIPRQLKRSLAR
jgi:hypothetical protein